MRIVPQVAKITRASLKERTVAPMPDPFAWLHADPQIRSLRLAVADLNGLARGKRLPVEQAEKVIAEGARMPLSALNVDIWGDDIAGSPLVFASGDADGVLHPTERGLVPMPWLEAPSALLPMWMTDEAGVPFEGDCRRALARVVERYKARGWTPVVATELEFYLVDDDAARPAPPLSPLTGRRVSAREVLALGGLDLFERYFSDLYAACAAMDIPADSAISESGPGQFEINLLHGPDALKAADDAWLLKQAVRGLARRHEMAATFMAKPYADYAGNGLHVHFSVIDAAGRNIFDDGTRAGTPMLGHAVAGCLEALRESTLIFAPHMNSYRRMAPNSHAPTAICWGLENRTAALRIPGGPASARRIEHRVAGGDANPYLAVAAVLGAALDGIEREAVAPPPVKGNAYDGDFDHLPRFWEDAMDLFEAGPAIARIFDPMLVKNLVACKRQELSVFESRWTDFEYATYLDTA